MDSEERKCGGSRVKSERPECEEVGGSEEVGSQSGTWGTGVLAMLLTLERPILGLG